jgi:DNA-binding GntR family transcriptional regulator
MREIAGGNGSEGRRPERRVLREEVRDQLIKAILDGHLAPGDRIVEMRIAEQFGVSQTPVREALRDLELFGFIASSPFKGATVRQMSTEDHLMLYPIRAVLEGLAARYAATRISEAALRSLDKLMTKMQRAAERGDERAQIAADFQFHRTIMEASGNWLLLQSWERMQLATTTFLTITRSQHSLQDIASRHARLIEALKARDPERAEQEMRRHIEEPGEWLQVALAQSRAGRSRNSSASNGPE